MRKQCDTCGACRWDTWSAACSARAAPYIPVVPGLWTTAGGFAAGGKSGLPRARWWVTPTVRKDRESATENKPPDSQLAGDGKGETAR